MYSSNINTPFGYSQISPIIPSPISQISKQTSSGGKTLLIVVSVLAATVLIGMALGLGLGIGAAGLINNGNLTNTYNTSTIINPTNATNSTG
ncbi:unnamed protein product [Rotaria sp. Silwood2]|nr:unnamed protein product [Rotaria sp. Silwood2]CAF2917861.1 unnamed protein product [Rotaria sp. Silwood2]CAF3250341.1 unnamed protein product [Rotaria sp. Silwood2]CAF4050246.1 unnamed protein product [Rotaria sp. Silwood2]CAF4091809.1 unnamed protein product [Rotaria sp. Silwood2]